MSGACRMAVAFSLLAAMSAAAHEFGDDYGDAATNAKAIAIGSNYSGRIEIDVDQDWFAFVATNSLKEYVVTVSTGTLWNSTLALTAVDGVTGIMQTDSVLVATSRVAWIHVGPPATYYVRVGGFAEFATGTYSIVVTEQSFADLDHDGMPDAWEQAFFGSTNQPPSGLAGDYDHDGVANIDEFREGADPTNPVSFLRLTDIAPQGQQTSIAWAAAPYRWYGVEVSTNLSTAGWNPLGTVTNLNTSGWRRFDDPTVPSPKVRFYRVRCLY